MTSLNVLIGTLVSLQFALGLQVTPGSVCAASCLHGPENDTVNPTSSSTNASEITCTDADYGNSSQGIKFKNCIECLQQSSVVKDNESDSQWFIYNLRYSLDVCLFGSLNTTKKVSSPCMTDYACQPLKTSLETGIYGSESQTAFSYCDADGSRFSESTIDSCMQCLRTSDEQQYMANFMIALQAGCEQRPERGALIGLSGSLFQDSPVTITAPSSNNTSNNDTPSTTVITTGAIVGIAVGASLLFLGGTALFWVYYRKQRRVYESDMVSKYDPRGGSISVTPPLKGAYAAFDSRPTSHRSQYELKAQAAYTNNAEAYTELEEEMASRQANYHFDPNQVMRGPSSALPVHPAYVPRAMGRAGLRDPSPEPPNPIRFNRPDDYASSLYYNAARLSNFSSARATLLSNADPLLVPPYVPSPMPTNAPNHEYRHFHHDSPPPPPRPPPSTLSRGASFNRRGTQVLLPGPPPPPPARAPRLNLPSVPKLRGAKKYQPPLIIVEDATPIAGSDESVPIGLDISNPLIQHGQRFGDESRMDTGTRPGTIAMSLPATVRGQVPMQAAISRHDKPFHNSAATYTSKTTIFD